MHPLVDITRPFKKYLKTLILNPEEYKTPNIIISIFDDEIGLLKSPIQIGELKIIYNKFLSIKLKI